MGVQARQDNNTVPFIKDGNSLVRNNVTLLKDAGRTAVLAPYTLLARVLASGKFVPFTDPTATDGTGRPSAIYLGEEIAAATIAADDVVGLMVLVGNAIIDKNQLVIENSKTLDTILATTTVNAVTVQDELERKGIFCTESVDISSQENS